MDFWFSHFSVLLRAILIYFKTKIIFRCFPKEFLPHKTPGKFPPRRHLPKKDPLAKNEFVQEMSHPSWQRVHVVWQKADIPKFNHLGNLFTENVMTQTRNSNSSETLLLINLLMFSTKSDMCPLLKTRHITKKKSHKVKSSQLVVTYFFRHIWTPVLKGKTTRIFGGTVPESQ